MMSGRRRYEDASTVLLLVPFVASGAYAIYLWVSGGLTAVLPSSVYLEVTRNSYVFLAGLGAVLLGLLLDLRGVDPQARRERLAWESGYLQKTAAACFVLSLVTAWYANGFLDVAGAADDFVVGRYSIVFPAVLVLLSYMLNPSLKLSGAASYRFLAFVAMLAVPAVVYEVGKRMVAAGLIAAAALIVVGVYLFLMAGRKAESESQG